MKKAIATIAIALSLLSAFTACGNNKEVAVTTPQITQESTEPAPVVLTGEWKQVNSGDDSSYHSATITADSIEIYWISDDDESKSLYWAGTFETPTEYKENFTVESVNDKEKTETALLASSDETKVFSYDGNQISYEASAMGTTKTIRLEKVQ